MRNPLRSMRGRLVVFTNLLVAFVLLAVGIGLDVSIRNYVTEQARDRTRSVPLFGGQRDGGRGPSDDTDGPDGDGPDGIGPDDDAYVLIRRVDGTVEEQPARLPDGTFVTLDVDIPASLPEPDDDPDGPAIFTTVDSVGGPFLAKISQMADGDVLVVAVSIADEQAVLRRLRVSVVIVSLGAVIVSSLIGAWVIRRGLRPLTKVEHAAERITAGDVDHRLDTTGDPTEVRRVGESLNTMLDRLNAALSRSRESEERMRAFVADASHELRTPVAAISAYAELFDRGAAERPDDLARAMRGIGRETTRAARLIDDLTTLARRADDHEHHEDVDLAGLIDDAVETSRAIDDRWFVDVDVRHAAVVRGDPVGLRRILDNLVANVRTHTPPGTGCRIVLDRRDDHVSLVVTDRGPGLAPDQLARAMDRFWRADPSRTRATGGSGLGLSIARMLTEAHGGSMLLRPTEPGPGLTVEVRLRPV